MNVFPQGSEWRKWDLHVHTPASILENQFGDDWDEYVVNLFRKAISEEIHAIGITDYYLPEGYRILRKEYVGNPEKMASLFTQEEIAKINRIALFANIEFRLTKLIIERQQDLKWNRKLNYHVILSDKLDVDRIESEFISQIKIDFNASPGARVEQRPLSRATLEELGRRLIAQHPPFAAEGSPLRVGMLNASVDENHLADLLNGNSYFRDSYLLGLPADEDLSKVSWNSQGHSIRKHLIKQANFVFSSNPKTVSFLLGGDDREKFVSEFGPIKPCLWGSDAHGYEKLFLPDDCRNTWVKADTTFEGLKQVIYDPESRVRIQELSPQQKSTYQTIKKVRFVDPAGKLFSSEWQPINPDLNTIIGGKSSGKSLLLYHIAKAINSSEVHDKTSLAKASTYSDIKGVDFEVEWTNGETSKLSDLADSKPITYIPQLYINHLAEEDGKEQLNALVKSILSQNDDFKDFLRDQEKSISDINKEIDGKIARIFELRGKYGELKAEQNAFATKDAIEEEVRKLNLRIQELREKSGFTPEQESNYKAFSTRINDLDRRLFLLQSIEGCSRQISQSVSNRKDFILSSISDWIKDDLDYPQDSSFVESAVSMLRERLSASMDEFKLELEGRVSKIPSNQEKVYSEKEKVEALLQPLKAKVEDRLLLETLIKKLKEEEQKLKGFMEIEAKKIALKSEGGQCREELHEAFRKLTDEYKKYTKEIEKPEYQLEANIAISAEVGFLEDKFSEFTKSFDGRGNLSLLLGDLVDQSGAYLFSFDDFANNIIEIDKRIIRKETPNIRKGVSEQDLTRRLFNDCLTVDYVVRYRGDEIARMSPGKRGLVLLNLILHLSNASHPILVDQPEDNLDNRTIYDQLNKFIRDRKNKRQIIMVTHNANLVVAADSECVIVANQDGQQANLENSSYRFEYCSGSLECSFDDPSAVGILNKKGIRQHVCEILEGGILAFKERELKYGLL